MTRQLSACRAITEDAERLACYDREVAALDQAVAKGDVVTLDREDVRRTRRSLFGFTLPAIRLFKTDDSDDAGQREAVTELESTIKSARQTGYGKWLLELEDGAVWTQTDTRRLVRDPRAGQPIRIRQAAMGSFLANVDGQVAIRVQRSR